MRAVVLTGTRAVELQDVAPPIAREDEVLVKVRATGICGSDVIGFLGHSPRRRPGLVMGHEVVGELLDGTRVTINPLITCGVCRACRGGRQNCCPRWGLLGMDLRHGGFAEVVAVPSRNLLPLQPKTSDLAAVMIEPLANAFHMAATAVAHAGPQASALLLGGGTLGACTVAAASACGVRVGAVSEPNKGRRTIMRDLGVPVGIDPISENLAERTREVFGPEGPDVVFECLGSETTRQQAAKLVASGGIAILLGLHENESTLGFHDIVRREIRMQGSFAYTENNFADAADFVESGAVDFGPWSRLDPLENAQAAFDLVSRSPDDVLKIALRP